MFMNKSTLALALRERLLAKKLVTKKLLDTVSDDDVIDSYITCSDCGAKSIKTKGELNKAILESKDVEDFLDKATDYHGLESH